MSGVRFVFPKPRLAELLKMPGGLPVVEALQRAQVHELVLLIGLILVVAVVDIIMTGALPKYASNHMPPPASSGRWMFCCVMPTEVVMSSVRVGAMVTFARPE